jgi:Tfp pilus assembly protein PilX
MIGGARNDDGGAALIIALVIISVVGLVAVATLSFAFVGIRTTVALRAEGADVYNADGAAQVAVNALRKDTFNGAAGQCVTTTSAMSLPNFYPGTTGSAASSAYVSCAPGAGNGSTSATSANASPGSAVLTLGTAAGENGIQVASNAGKIKVRGGVFSNSTINIMAGGIDNTYNNPPSLPYNLARGACANQSLIIPTAYTTCNYTATDPRGSDPGTLTPHGASYDPPPVAPGNGTIGTCPAGTKYQTVTPGRFTDAAALTDLSGCTTGIVYFQPGTYYFDFTAGGNHVWTVEDTYLIAGTPTIPLTAAPAPAQMPGSCLPPADAAATTSTGVRFVFGGDSRLELGHKGNPGGQIAICASRSASGPPIAVYGLKTALGGSFPVAAQSGCVSNVWPVTPNCQLIITDQSPDVTLTIQGTTYTPKASITLNLNNSTNQVFRWGLITRALKVGTTGSANLSTALIDVPDVAVSPIQGPNLMYLNIYVCPAASTCGSSGKLRLRAKLQISGSAPRTVTVLSWSTQR